MGVSTFAAFVGTDEGDEVVVGPELLELSELPD